jgi:hypothetical protein
MCACLSSCVLEYKKTHNIANVPLSRDTWLVRFRLEFAIVVVPEFASVVEFEPRTFRGLALSVESVSEQAAYAPLTTARKIRGEVGERGGASFEAPSLPEVCEVAGNPEFQF